ncbi:YMGG-like glycine zipper-containing protein [Cupriavidus sp. 30B13]|uniref:YMGG-like glycine zipper-containing protein n=1 Tax=Cupriavidus sp. 30B13 TaxID=3384241 RepID=UPI003B8F0A86
MRPHLVAAGLLLLAAGAAQAQKPIVYPAKGQSPTQQSQDEADCAGWAKQTTGVDPAAIASTPPPAPAGPTGARVRGAARGAAAGAVVGDVANDDAGHGAAVGAAAGVVAGGVRSRREHAAQAQQAQNQQAGTQAAMGTYWRAVGACMQGRGYTLQ